MTTQSKKMQLIKELLEATYNEENLLAWAGAYLGSISYKSVKAIYKREFGL